MSDIVAKVASELKAKFDSLEDKRAILRSPELKKLYTEIKNIAPDERPAFGQAVNALKEELQVMVEGYEAAQANAEVKPLDVTAPFDINVPPHLRPTLLGPEIGSRHPISIERAKLVDIFVRMGFDAVESRQIDDDYHMFGALNFPEGHPARDDYDTFMTEEGLIPPAHTSTMQNRILKSFKPPIRVVIPGRTFRNEDTDARHEHTFNQFEGVYVDKNINVGHLVATLKEFLQQYYGQDLEVKMQPFYFPFVEPGFEFALSCPFCKKQGCHVCSQTGWVELLGCGMIHPNVLREGGIDPEVYSGFAWGCGIDRLVMMKYDIEDIRHFHAGKLEFLRQFK